MYDIVIVGGGVAGLTAALYAKRAGKSVIVIEKNTFGGQITWSPKVENYPSVTSVSGLELGDLFTAQAEANGVEMTIDEVTSLSAHPTGYQLTTAFGETYLAKAVILATGAKPRSLGLDREADFVGNGISYCAVCDGEFYREKNVAIVGGGNSALQEALYLADLCRSVAVIHRRESFRADEALVNAVKNRANIQLAVPAQVTSIEGDTAFEGVTLSYTDGKIEYLPIDGLFVAIGHEPQNELFSEWVKCTKDGYADTDESCTTESKGIFVAGDCRAKAVRQLTTATADGTVAAIAACQYLNTLL